MVPVSKPTTASTRYLAHEVIRYQFSLLVLGVVHGQSYTSQRAWRTHRCVTSLQVQAKSKLFEVLQLRDGLNSLSWRVELTGYMVNTTVPESRTCRLRSTSSPRAGHRLLQPCTGSEYQHGEG